MKTQDKEVTGFDFQIIPLQDAQNLVAAGSGNYSDLKAKLLDAIPKLDGNQAFTFGLPKGEVPEMQRRGIAMAINTTMRRAKLAWRCTYSSARNLFVVIPTNPTKSTTPTSIAKPVRSTPEFDAQVLALKQQNVSLSGIAKKLGITQSRVSYILYSKHKPPKPTVKVAPVVKASNSIKATDEQILNLARTTELGSRTIANKLHAGKDRVAKLLKEHNLR